MNVTWQEFIRAGDYANVKKIEKLRKFYTIPVVLIQIGSETVVTVLKFQ